MTFARATATAIALVAALCLGGTAAADEHTAAHEPLVGDPVRGKIVYQRIGYCVNCDGWAGDGKTGRTPRAPDDGASLRDTLMDAETLIMVVRCGLPGTQMPYHEGAAYRDDRCHGLTLADFEPGSEPIRGKTFREADARNVVAYLRAHMVGLGHPTYEECVHYFEASADKACSFLAPTE